MPGSEPCDARFPAHVIRCIHAPHPSGGFAVQNGNPAVLSFRLGLFRQYVPVQSEKASASMPRPFGLLTQTPFRCSARRTGGKFKGTLRAQTDKNAVVPAEAGTQRL